MIPKFGEKVIYNRQLKRRKGARRKVGRAVFYDVNLWENVDKPGSGLFLGFRTLKNGIRDYDSEDGYTFRATEHIRAALISPGLRRNPIYVQVEEMVCITK